MLGFWAWLYAASMVIGLGYLALLMLTGEMDADGDVDIGDTDFDVGGDVEGAGEVPDDLDGGSDFSFFSPKFIASLLLGFGGMGLFALWTLAIPWYLHLPAAMLGGWGAGFILFRLLARFIYASQGSSEVRVNELWGTIAEVTIPIPRERLGEVRFIARGSRFILPARSANGEGISRGQTVIIERVESSVAIVRATR